MPAEPCRHLTSALNNSMKTTIIRLFGNDTHLINVKTSWPYFGVKLRKKLPIVTIR